jgi:hypothetical protein
MKSQEQVELALRILKLTLAPYRKEDAELSMDEQIALRSSIDILSWILDKPNHFGENVIDPLGPFVEQESTDDTVTE